MSPQPKPEVRPARSTATQTKDSLSGLLSRFAAVGLAASLTYLVVANLLLVTPIAAPFASVLAYAAGMVVSFRGQSQFTFRAGKGTPQQFARFLGLSALGFTISFFAVYVAQSVFGLPPVIGTFFTVVLVPAASFIVMKIWVFQPAPQQE